MQIPILKKHQNSLYVYRMKLFISTFLLILLITGCNNQATQLREKIIGADSVAINYFKGDGTMDTVVAVKIIKDSVSMQQLTDLITASKTSIKSNCGYSGSIHFFKNDRVIQDVFFSNKEDCNQFSFTDEGQRSATRLSADAIRLLQSIRNK